MSTPTPGSGPEQPRWPGQPYGQRPPFPPPWPQQPPAYAQPRRPRRKGMPLIIIGVIVAAAGLAGLLYIARAMSLCGSSLGAYSQAVDHAAATYCAQDGDFHAVSVLVLAAGVVMAVGGIVRRIVSARSAAAWPPPPAGPPGAPWQPPGR